MENEEYTVEQLQSMSIQELEELYEKTKPASYSNDILKLFDVGIYDNGNLIGDKEDN